MGCHFLLHGIFPTQELNLRLLPPLHRQADFFFLPLSHLGSLHLSVAQIFTEALLSLSSGDTAVNETDIVWSLWLITKVSDGV